jgi:galactonate dehydratase
MKIESITCFAVEPHYLFVKIATDERIVGWGECLGDKAAVQAAAVQSYEHYLLGADPHRIVHHWESMYRGAFWRGGPNLSAAISGIEMALWDILGKTLDVPVYQLLGGAVRERIRVYSRVQGETPEELAASAAQLVQQGFTAMKFPPLAWHPTHHVDRPQLVRDTVAKMRAVRETVGDGIDVALDFHGMASPAMSIWLEEALRPYYPFFIEEPVLPENTAALARLAPQFKTPLATGERLFTRWGFRELFESGAASIVQPDPHICGGIFETRQIAAMAETYYVALAPHCSAGPVGLAACLQIDACAPNFLIQECPGWRILGQGGYLKQPFVVEDGYLALPSAPGLGVEPDEAFLRSLPLGTVPDVGRWFHEDDGAVADW